MTNQEAEYHFHNTGEKEVNDVIYPGRAFPLLYHSYIFALTPGSHYWRFGMRFAAAEPVPFNSRLRYFAADYADIQVLVGERPEKEWIKPNQISLGNYPYYKGHEDHNPFDVQDSYSSRGQVVVRLWHDVAERAIMVQYNTEGCKEYRQRLEIGDYRYFQIFAWADAVAFDLHCRISISDSRYLQLPTVPLTEWDEKWLRILYDKFKRDAEVNSEHTITDLWNNFPTDFDPKGINPLLVRGGTEITLYGIYHIDPFSPIFENFDRIIGKIRDRLQPGNIPEMISSAELQVDLPELNGQDISLVFRQIGSLTNLSGGTGRLADGARTIRLNTTEVLEGYRKYPGLQTYYANFLKKLVGTGKIDATTQQAELALDRTLLVGRTPMVRAKSADFDPVMGVMEIADATADILEGFKGETGQMIGIFGRWGRGKTFLIDRLYDILAARRQVNLKKANWYIRVDFPAWKYQETPAVWAHLYEVLADAYLGKKRFFSWYWPRLVWLNLHRNKIWPLLSLLVAATATVTLPILTAEYIKNKWLYWLGFTPAFLTMALSVLRQLQKPLSTKANALTKRYLIRHSFKPTLGLQAEIQEELIKLIKTWVPERCVSRKQILLVVEDLDRCGHEKIIELIDALRVMLEDKEIAKRLVVIAAIDETILKNAIRLKYASLDFSFGGAPTKDQVVSEYLDKLFISAIKLGELTKEEIGEFADQVLTRYAGKPPAPDAGESSDTTSVLQQAASSISETPVFASESSGPVAPSPETNSELAPEQAVAGTGEPKDGFTNLERQYFKMVISEWKQPTPRAMIIFYFRYLLCKNLLINRYRQRRLFNIWQTTDGIKGLMTAIVEFGTAHDPSKINAKRREVLQQPETATIPIANGHPAVNQTHYLFMLDVLEIVISY